MLHKRNEGPRVQAQHHQVPQKYVKQRPPRPTPPQKRTIPLRSPEQRHMKASPVKMAQVNSTIALDSRVSSTFGKGVRVLATHGIIPEQNTTASTFPTSGYSSLSARPFTTNKHSDLINFWDNIRHDSLRIIQSETSSLNIRGTALVHFALVGYPGGEFYPTIQVDLKAKLSVQSFNFTSSIVKRIGKLVDGWKDEKIYVYVCHSARSSSGETALSQDTVNVNLYQSLYEDHTLYLGASISVSPGADQYLIEESCDSPPSQMSGTFTCFIKHQEEFFGLTCRHVVDPWAQFQDGMPVEVISPSDPDQKETVNACKLDGKAYNQHSYSLGTVLKVFGTGHKRYNPHIPDWALVKLHKEIVPVNKFPETRIDYNDLPSGNLEKDLTLSVHEKLNEDFHGQLEELSKDGQKALWSYLSSGSALNPLSTHLSTHPSTQSRLAFKRKSRTTQKITWGWVNPAKSGCAGLWAEVGNDQIHDLGDFNTIVCPQAAFSAAGDSGGIILDSSLRPFANVTGGGPDDPKRFHFTIVLLFSEIFRAIEKELEWEVGSVSLA